MKAAIRRPPMLSWHIKFWAFTDDRAALHTLLIDGWEPYAVDSEGHYLRKQY